MAGAEDVVSISDAQRGVYSPSAKITMLRDGVIRPCTCTGVYGVQEDVAEIVFLQELRSLKPATRESMTSGSYWATST